jgi:hypothetical protein
MVPFVKAEFFYISGGNVRQSDRFRITLVQKYSLTASLFGWLGKKRLDRFAQLLEDISIFDLPAPLPSDNLH